MNNFLNENCPICLQHITDFYRLDGCQHRFCRSCLVQCIQNQVNGMRYPIICPCLDCGQNITNMPKIGKNFRKRFLKMKQTFFQCPYMLCQQIFWVDSDNPPDLNKNKVQNCPSCHQSICHQCFEPCPGKEECPCQVNLEYMIYKLNTSKRCPRCKIWLTRFYGCDSVWCQGCQNFFNWNGRNPPNYNDIRLDNGKLNEKLFGQESKLIDPLFNIKLEGPPSINVAGGCNCSICRRVDDGVDSKLPIIGDMVGGFILGGFLVIFGYLVVKSLSESDFDFF